MSHSLTGIPTHVHICPGCGDIASGRTLCPSCKERKRQEQETQTTIDRHRSGEAYLATLSDMPL